MAEYRTFGEHTDSRIIEFKVKLAELAAGLPAGLSALAMLEMIILHARQPESSQEYRAALADMFASASVQVQQGDRLKEPRFLIVGKL